MNPEHHFLIPMAYLMLWSAAGIKVLTTFIDGQYLGTLGFGLVMIWFAASYTKSKKDFL